MILYKLTYASQLGTSVKPLVLNAEAVAFALQQFFQPGEIGKVLICHDSTVDHTDVWFTNLPEILEKSPQVSIYDGTRTLWVITKWGTAQEDCPF